MSRHCLKFIFEMELMTEKHDPYAAFRSRNYRFYISGKLLSNLGGQMRNVAVGWQLYEQTGSAMALGMVGLIQALPIIIFALPAGHIADRFNRKQVVFVTQTISALCSFGLAWLSLTYGSIPWIYTCLLLGGIARSFNYSSSSALLPQIVSPTVFGNAVTWNSNAFQIASVLGPALGGGIMALQKSATIVYVLDALGSLLCGFFILRISGRQTLGKEEPMTLKSLTAGINFIWNSKVILAALTLDLFAVLLGGAETLLPIYAKDILQVGPAGLGWLRAAPFIGAFSMSLIIAHAPPFKKAGKSLLYAVVGFGIAVIIFGISQWFWLSMFMLFLMGVFDSVSVVVRHTLVQVLTPDHMRGRVSAVNGVFIGSSNELGGFESGLVAAWLGPVISVVSGGIGTILVVLGVVAIWPEIKNLGSLHPPTKEAVDPNEEIQSV